MWVKREEICVINGRRAVDRGIIVVFFGGNWMSHLKLVYNRIQKSQTKYKNLKDSENSDDAGVKIPSKKIRNVFTENFKSSPKKKDFS